MSQITDALEKVANSISPYDVNGAKYFRKLKGSSAKKIADDISIWGGSGSYMDQALYNQPRSLRLPFEAAAIELGFALINAGAHNDRMEGWVNAFESWAENDV